MKVKSIAMVLATLMLVVGMVSGSLAWLTANTTDVKNTFTTSDISIGLAESDNLDLKMVPGYSITKDPKVWVNEGSEKCYLFVELVKSANYDTYLDEPEFADDWTELEDIKDDNGNDRLIAYRAIDEDSKIGKDVTYCVLKDNKVTVKGSVTKENMTSAEKNKPELIVKAYASQLYKDGSNTFTAAEAWANIASSTPIDTEPEEPVVDPDPEETPTT